MFVAFAVCFVWDTEPDFPTIGIRARFSYHFCITCDWVLEFKKMIIFVFSNFCIKLLFHKPCVHWSIYVIYCFARFQEDTGVTFVLCRMFLVFVFIKDTIYTSCELVCFCYARLGYYWPLWVVTEWNWNNHHVHVFSYCTAWSIFAPLGHLISIRQFNVNCLDGHLACVNSL